MKVDVSENDSSAASGTTEVAGVVFLGRIVHEGGADKEFVDNVALGKRIVSTEPPPVAEPKAILCTGLSDVAGIIDIVVTATLVEEMLAELLTDEETRLSVALLEVVFGHMEYPGVLDAPPVNVVEPSVVEIILENQPDELVFPEALEVLFKAEVTGASAAVLGVEL